MSVRARARVLRPLPLLAMLAAGMLALVLPGRASAQQVPLEIRTVPPYPGITVELGGHRAVTDRSGTARLSYGGAPSELRRLAVGDALVRKSVRTRFARWYGNLEKPRVGQLTAALVVDYRVRFSFSDVNGKPVPPGRVSLLVLRGSHGVMRRFTSEELRSGQWFEGTRVVSTPRGPQAKDIQYSVERAIVDGANVVNRAQQRFFPRTQRRKQVELLFFTMQVSAHDALFRFPIGSAVRVQAPNGRWREYPFESNAEVVIPGLPRGDYMVEVRAPGFSFLRPVSLSRNQSVSLEVVSYVDIAVVGSVLLAAALGLLLIGRPYLLSRARVRGAAFARHARRAFLLCLLVGALGLGSTATATAASPAPVLAYYYIWFNVTSWDRAKTDYPKLGRYSSDERLVMRQHVRWARQAGIDGFIVSWKSTPTLDRRLQQLVEIAERERFGLVVIYQGLDFARDPLPTARVQTDLERFAQHFGRSPAFRVFGEKPAVIWSGTWKFSKRDIEGVAASVRDRLLLLASDRSAGEYGRLRGVVDGNAYYWPADFVRHPGGARKLEDLADAVHADGGLWIAPATPGFDARLLGGRMVIPRRDGDTLRAGMDAALRSSPDAIGLISWNEFSENTHVEPSERYGTSALEALADIEGSKPVFRAELDSSEPLTPPASTGVQYAVPMLVGTIVLAFVLMTTAIWRSRRRGSPATPGR